MKAIFKEWAVIKCTLAGRDGYKLNENGSLAILGLCVPL
jgi:hypothetical protein